MDRDITISEISKCETCFAPGERDSYDQIAALHRLIVDAEPQLKVLLDSIPLMVVILNSKRQIVAANRQVVEIAGGNIEHILGKRPGELVECIHAGEGPNGCGTSMSCRVCGAVNAILMAQSENRYCTEECRISTGGGHAVDWKVAVNPIEIAGHKLQCLTIEDISDHKRREVLEKTFFHDLVNTIGGIVGFSRLLAETHEPSDEAQEIIQMADALLEEVQSQRELTLAENGDLVQNKEKIQLLTFLRNLIHLYQNHQVAEGRSLCIKDVEEAEIVTDARLLKRVLGNMIKNALEASNKGDEVSISSRLKDGRVTVFVHNPGVMPEDVKLQIFKRSFSTKGGQGHGIGTYSMKLLGEQYLGGYVSFTSEEGEGTTFSITLPRS